MTDIQTNQAIEPVLVVDVTGSMAQPAASGVALRKYQVVEAVVEAVVNDMAKLDSAGADEEGGGGVLTYTFADGKAAELGDLNPTNFKKEWAKVKWDGGTYIMPAFRKAEEEYAEEFGDVDPADQPKMVLGVITDGALQDFGSATAWLNSVHGNMYVEVVLVGFGSDFDNALAQWQSIASTNNHVRVEAFNSSTDVHAIAKHLVDMFS